MKHIFGNLKKYWYMVIMIIVLLIGQAYCDLSLPDYTSNIIDVGIANSGIEHTTPEYISEKTYAQLSLFLTDEEKEELETAYKYNEEKKCFVLANTSEKAWNENDKKFQNVEVIVFMMTSQQDSSASGMDMTSFDMTQAPDPSKMTPEQIEQYQNAVQKIEDMGLDIKSPTLLLDIRNKIEEEVTKLGDTMVVKVAKSFALQEYKACKIDTDEMQADYMWSAGAKMLLMTLLMVLAAISVGFLASRVSAGVGRDLREKVFTKVIGFSDAGMDRFSTATLITRTTNDVQQIQMVTVFLLRMVLYAPILAMGGIINIQQYECGMSWIIVLAVALVMCLIAVLMVVAMPKFNIMQNLVDRVNLVSREILTGLPVIRAFSREKREEERFEKANSDLTSVMLFTNKAMSFMMPALMFIMNGVSVLIIWVAAKKIDQGVMDVGAMIAFITYSMLIIMGFLMLTAIAIMLPRAAVAANRIHEVLETPNVIVNKENAKTEKADKAVVRFEHVDFMYHDGEENALSDIDFTAYPGQTTAIIGSTGCGKSTLVKLIPRFFDVSSGKITLDGVDVRDLDIKTLRSQIGYVPQKGMLFSGDIQSNILYGATDLSEENMKEAAKIAQATEFIDDKPETYNSEIAQGGSNVSGGQKQRLSIARAIARNPKIYIFDDSFSALDFKTDTALRKALESKTKDATVFIVAQRVSTIMNADQILVLDEGQIVGKGTHNELIENCETYRQIAESQLSEAELYKSLGKEGK